MNLRVFDTPEHALRAAGRAIAQRAAAVEQIAIGISGGRTPMRLYEMLAEEPAAGVLRERSVTWVLVDERYVPLGHPQSNSGAIRSTLFREGIPPRHRFLDFDTSPADPDESAADFERRWHSHGLTRLDIAVLGIGPDGHTASLFPGTPVLEVSDRVAAAVHVPAIGQWRVTLTAPVLRAARLRMVLATGGEKNGVLQDVARGVQHPVAIAMSGEGEAWWLADEQAAKNVMGATAAVLPETKIEIP